MIQSLRHWWSLSGVDQHYAERPSALLSDGAALPVAITKPVQKVTDQASDAVTESVMDEGYPQTHQEFMTWLATPEKLAEGNWSRNFVLPTGPLNPELMVITGIPEQDGLAENSLYSAKSMILLQNMIRAIGCDSAKTYFASLALTRPVEGRIEQQYYQQFKDRMIHHIELVQPRRLIIFGDTSSMILFGENLLTIRKKKQYINHVSSKTEAVVTFHPRILLQRPEFKAEAWKDLQMLTRIADL